MSHPKLRRKDMMGQHLTSKDGVCWSWSLDGVSYTYCPDGWLTNFAGMESVKVFSCVRIEGAVGYTLGLHDGLGKAHRGSGAEVG